MGNKDEGVCDWPQNVDEECNGVTPKPTDAPTEAPTPEPCEDGIYPHETECNKFYQCANGHRWPDQKCPEPLLFSSVTDQCEHPRDVLSERDDCGDIEYCEDGIYPIPGDCSGFFMCSNGIQWENQYCPDELFSNPAEGICDWPNNVDCGKEPPKPPSHNFCFVKCLLGKGEVSECLEKCF